MNLPARAPSGTFALPASTRGTRARGRQPWAFILRGPDDRLREAASPGHFPAYISAPRFVPNPGDRQHSSAFGRAVVRSVGCFAALGRLGLCRVDLCDLRENLEALPSRERP